MDSANKLEALASVLCTNFIRILDPLLVVGGTTRSIGGAIVVHLPRCPDATRVACLVVHRCPIRHYSRRRRATIRELVSGDCSFARSGRSKPTHRTNRQVTFICGNGIYTAHVGQHEGTFVPNAAWTPRVVARSRRRRAMRATIR